MTNSKKAQAQAKRAEQTKNAHSAFMAKMTKTQFAEKYNDVDGVLDIEEIKKATEVAKKLNPLDETYKKAYKSGCIKYKFFQDGMSFYVSAAFVLGREEYPLNGRFKYARLNTTKVSFDYDMLSYLYEKLFERADSVYGVEEEITCRLVKNPEGGYNIIVPQGIEVKRVLYGKEADNE